MALDLLPLEDDEQVTFVQWLELESLKFTAIPNSTYTKSWSQKNKNKRMGLRAGLPDLLVLIPPSRSVNGRGFCLFIEMKRQKRGTVSPDQQAWLDALNALDEHAVAGYVARGAQEAIDLVTKHLKPGSAPSPF